MVCIKLKLYIYLNMKVLVYIKVFYFLSLYMYFLKYNECVSNKIIVICVINVCNI